MKKQSTEATRKRIALMIIEGGMEIAEVAKNEGVAYNTVWGWVNTEKKRRSPKAAPKTAPAKKTHDTLEHKLLKREVAALKEEVAAYKSALKFALE